MSRSLDVLTLRHDEQTRMFAIVPANPDELPVLLVEEIARRRRQTGSAGTVIENSKVGDSSSNGRTERAVQEVGGLVRTLKFAFD